MFRCIRGDGTPLLLAGSPVAAGSSLAPSWAVRGPRRPTGLSEVPLLRPRPSARAPAGAHLPARVVLRKHGPHLSSQRWVCVCVCVERLERNFLKEKTGGGGAKEMQEIEGSRARQRDYDIVKFY